MTDVAHPLVDAVGETPDGRRWSVTETRASVVFLTPGRVNLLNRAAAAGRRVVLVTDELSVLTPVLTDVWRDAGACWVVRDARGGLREGFGGRRLATVADVLDPPRPGVDEVAVGHLRPVHADAMEVVAVVSVRHPARGSTRLGTVLTSLAEATLGEPPRVWGTTEPVGEPWDEAALTEELRGRMPAETMVFAAGRGLSASISAQRTEHGVEEVTHAHLAVVRPNADDVEGVRARLATRLVQLASTSMPLAGLLLSRPNRQDLRRPPLLVAPPAPMALLVGAPAVRSLGIDARALAARPGAELVGRPRLPGLLFRFGAYGPQAWEQLDRVVSALGPELLQVLGLAGAVSGDQRPAPGGGDGGA